MNHRRARVLIGAVAALLCLPGCALPMPEEKVPEGWALNVHQPGEWWTQPLIPRAVVVQIPSATNVPLDVLDPRAREAVEQRFGLTDGQRRSYREVGEDLGVTAEAARRLVKRAVNTVRDRALATAS